MGMATEGATADSRSDRKTPNAYLDLRFQHNGHSLLTGLYPQETKSGHVGSEVVQEVLAEPFPGTVAQGDVLAILKEFRRS